MKRVRKELEAPRLRVEKGELKEAEKIGAAAARVLGRNHGHRYFRWELRHGQFHYFEHPANFARETACEGKYVIRTKPSTGCRRSTPCLPPPMRPASETALCGRGSARTLQGRRRPPPGLGSETLLCHLGGAQLKHPAVVVISEAARDRLLAHQDQR